VFESAAITGLARNEEPVRLLRELVARRVTDGVVRRLIDKWLKAGVLDNGQLSYPELATPQGGVIAPATT
jgi:hypothetical protein